MKIDVHVIYNSVAIHVVGSLDASAAVCGYFQKRKEEKSKMAAVPT
jgi:hypothetical protein